MLYYSSLEACLFFNKTQKGEDLDGEGSREVLGKVEGKGRETVIRL